VTVGIGLGLLRESPGQGGYSRIDFNLPGPEYVYVDWIRMRTPDGSALNPTAITPRIALVPGDVDTKPDPSTWSNGIWSASPPPSTTSITAAFLVGVPTQTNPTCVNPAPGEYTIWVSIIGGVESPSRSIGVLVVS
jgi:hypothetical protein